MSDLIITTENGLKSRNFTDEAWQRTVLHFLNDLETWLRVKGYTPKTTFKTVPVGNGEMKSFPVTTYVNDKGEEIVLNSAEDQAIRYSQEHPKDDPADISANYWLLGGLGLTRPLGNMLWNGIRTYAPYLSASTWVGKIPYLTNNAATLIDAGLMGIPTGASINNMIENGPTVENVLGTTVGLGGLSFAAWPTVMEGVQAAKTIYNNGTLWDRYTTLGGRLGYWGNNPWTRLKGTVLRRFNLGTPTPKMPELIRIEKRGINFHPEEGVKDRFPWINTTTTLPVIAHQNSNWNGSDAIIYDPNIVGNPRRYLSTDPMDTFITGRLISRRGVPTLLDYQYLSILTGLPMPNFNPDPSQISLRGRSFAGNLLFATSPPVESRFRTRIGMDKKGNYKQGFPELTEEQLLDAARVPYYKGIDYSYNTPTDGLKALFSNINKEPRYPEYALLESELDNSANYFYNNILRPLFDKYGLTSRNQLFDWDNKRLQIVKNAGEGRGGFHGTYSGENIVELNNDIDFMHSAGIHEAASHGTDKFIPKNILDKYQELLDFLEFQGNTKSFNIKDSDKWYEMRGTLNQAKDKLKLWFEYKPDGTINITEEALANIPDEELLKAIETANSYGRDYVNMYNELLPGDRDRFLKLVRNTLLYPSIVGTIIKLNNEEY